MSGKGFWAWLALVVLACVSTEGWAACSPNCPTASASGAIQSTILGPVSVASVSNLSFGTVVRPATSVGNGTVSVSTGGARTVSGTGAGAGLALGSTTASRARLTITAEGQSGITVTVPPSVTLTAGGNSLSVTLTNNLTGGTAAQTMGGTAGSDATLTVDIGGSFSLADTTARGAYSGSFTVTAAYQ